MQASPARGKAIVGHSKAPAWMTTEALNRLPAEGREAFTRPGVPATMDVTFSASPVAQAELESFGFKGDEGM